MHSTHLLLVANFETVMMLGTLDHIFCESADSNIVCSPSRGLEEK